MTDHTTDAAEEAAPEDPIAPEPEAENSVSPATDEVDEAYIPGKPTALSEQIAKVRASGETKPRPSRKKAEPAPDVADAVVGLGERDDVSLKACVFENKYARKSLTVHHLQRRLRVLGYHEAYADRDGWYGELTRSSVRQFQEDRGLEATGLMDKVTFEAVFEGDPNVRVVA